MNITNLFKLINDLSNVQRYSTNFMIKPESVLEHTGSVCLITSMLALHLIKKGFKPDSRLGFKSALHDIEESVTGDIPRTTKYHSSNIRQGLQVFEEESVNKLVDDLDLPPSVSFNWEESKQDSDGMLVKIADQLCVTYKLWTEICLLNNFSLAQVTRDHYPGYERLLKELESHKEHQDDVGLNVINELIKLVKEGQLIAIKVVEHVNRSICRL